MEKFGVNELVVNEQNPQTRGFYEHMGFAVRERSELDEQGNPYPICLWKEADYGRNITIFDFHPDAFPLYDKFEKCVMEHVPEVRIKVQKTQISFYNRHMFACVSLRE